MKDVVRKWLLPAALLLVILVMVVSAYSNTLNSPLVLDDFHSFATEPKVLSFSGTFVETRKLLETKFGIFRFIPVLTFALDRHFGAGKISTFHKTNILIHLAATLALCFFLSSLIAVLKKKRLSSPDAGFDKIFLLVIFVGIWSLNPVQTNAVTYIVQRMTSLAALFYFLAMGFYCRGRCYTFSPRKTGKALLLYALFLFFCICALLSKQNAATLPVAILGLELVCFRNQDLFRLAKKYFIPLLLVLVVLFWFVAAKMFPGILNTYQHRHFTMWERVLTELRVVVSYLGVFLLPLPGYLNLEHDVAVSTGLFSPFTTFFALLLIGVMLVVSLGTRKKYPVIAYGILFFFLNLVIESTIVGLELKFEHRLYLPSVGLCLALYGVASIFYDKIAAKNFFTARDLKALAFSMGIIICSILSLLTYTRNHVWKDAITLYRDCLQKSADKPRVHSNLARYLANDKQYTEAIKESEIGMALGRKGYDVYWVSANNIVSSLSAMGKIDQAIERGENFLDSEPEYAKKNVYPIFLYNMGKLYSEKRRYLEAWKSFREAFELAKRCDMPVAAALEKAMVNVLYSVANSEDEKSKSLLKLGKGPRSVNIRMAEYFFRQGNLEKAKKYCLQPKDKSGENTKIADLLQHIEKIEKYNREQVERGIFKTKYAEEFYRDRFHFCMALGYMAMKTGIYWSGLLDPLFTYMKKTNPDCADVYCLSSWYLYKKGFYHQAVIEINKALELDSGYARLLFNRGIYCFALGEYGGAVTDFVTGLKIYPTYPHKLEIESMLKLARKKLSNEKPKKKLYRNGGLILNFLPVERMVTRYV